MKKLFWGIVLTALVAGCGGGGGGTNQPGTSSNSPPVASAGSIQNVTTGTLVTLNGSASSDANSDPLTYSWTLTSKPASSAATLTGATSAAPTFTADLAGTYVASLVVNDGKVNSAIATVAVTAAPSGGTPVRIQMGGAIQGTSLSLSTSVTTFAGSGITASIDGIGTAASFSAPKGITTDGTNLYVADSFNGTIRRIVISTGAVTTLAGRGFAGAVDGTGIVAAFNAPTGITTDGTNLYVADEGNNMIRKIVISTGVVTTMAGSVLAGSTGGTGTAALFDHPKGITTDGTNLYVADSFNGTIRRIVISTGVVTTLAGNPSLQSKINTALNGTVDGIGAAATFLLPAGITTDGTNLYVMGIGVIRKIVIATGAVSTLAGSVICGGNVDGTGTAAAFGCPFDITTDGTNLYVPDSTNRTIRKIVISTGVVTTLAGSGTVGTLNGIGTAASFAFPMGITTDGTSLFVADRDSNTIRKIQ